MMQSLVRYRGGLILKQYEKDVGSLDGFCTRHDGDIFC